MDLKPDLVLIEKALRTHAQVMAHKANNLPSNASTDQFAAMAYESLDADNLADKIQIHRRGG